MQKNLSWTLGVNEFADLTADEFFSTHLGYQVGASRLKGLTNVPFLNNTDVPNSIDWVSKGAVTPVKNQQQCGSCWAFSTTGSLEGAYFLATSKLVSFSEEELVQCDETDTGCHGGLMDTAFEWVKSNALCTEEAYPYMSGGGTTGTCKKSSCTAAATLAGYVDVPSQDEPALMKAVATTPVSVVIMAVRRRRVGQSDLHLYSGGVLDDRSCGTELDHAVLAVGYGTDDGKDYWKVKNSWGESWGESGYIRMARNKNMCGIAEKASYPTGVKPEGPSPGPSPPTTPPTPSPMPPSPAPPTEQCIKGKLGPPCSVDADCNLLPGCSRCANSGHCTDVPIWNTTNSIIV